MQASLRTDRIYLKFLNKKNLKLGTRTSANVKHGPDNELRSTEVIVNADQVGWLPTGEKVTEITAQEMNQMKTQDSKQRVKNRTYENTGKVNMSRKTITNMTTPQ